MKIVVLDGYTENPGDLSWAGLERLGEVTVHERTTGGAQQVIGRIGDAEAVYTNKTPITREVIDACADLRFIGVLATGYNVVDVEAARKRHIPVCNIPAYSTEAVGQFTIALLLEICCRVGQHDAAVHAGRWSACSDFCFWDTPLMELAGKTIGLIGFGRIGQRTAQIARALGMNVLYNCRTPKPEAEGPGCRFAPLDELLAGSDVISLHCPLFPQTQGIICRESIARMKDGVILINTSRGALIVEEDLAAALESGKVRAAAMDVASVEPIRADNPLLSAPNCIITPHIAWAAKETRKRLMACAVGNLERFMAGDPVNVVNRWDA